MVDQPDELTITLKRPLKTKAGADVSEIALREPTGAEWRTWDKLSGVEADIAAVAKVSGQHPELIGQMAASQLVEGATYIAGFLNAVPQTGVSE